MTRSRPISFLAVAAAVPLAALAIAGCGSSSSNNNSSGTTAQISHPKTASGQAATLGVANGSLGKILVDSQGRTLYLFQADKGTKSACTGACAAAWPPLRSSGQPTAGAGATASMLGTTKRSDGKPGVTYNGHPLYTFADDQSAGDTTGQGVNAFGGLWYVVSPAGSQITSKPSTPKGGGGY
jgi:predicted lipoprotein with Yx(FWY)xxD motif